MKIILHKKYYIGTYLVNSAIHLGIFTFFSYRPSRIKKVLSLKQIPHTYYLGSIYFALSLTSLRHILLLDSFAGT